MQITGGIIFYLSIVGVVHVTQFFACDADLPTTSSEESNVFTTIRGYATFTQCGGEHEWWTFLLFTVFTLPILLILASYLFQMFSNAVTGTTLALTLIIVGLLALFS